METRKDFSNNLLKRRELVVILNKDSNPGFEIVKKEVARKFKADEGLVVLKNVKGEFGSGEFRVDAFIYEDKESMERIEPKKKEKKEGV